MITVTYDYTGQNFHCANYSKTFDTKVEFQNWITSGKRPYIWHVTGL